MTALAQALKLMIDLQEGTLRELKQELKQELERERERMSEAEDSRTSPPAPPVDSPVPLRTL